MAKRGGSARKAHAKKREKKRANRRDRRSQNFEPQTEKILQGPPESGLPHPDGPTADELRAQILGLAS